MACIEGCDTYQLLRSDDACRMPHGALAQRCETEHQEEDKDF